MTLNELENTVAGNNELSAQETKTVTDATVSPALLSQSGGKPLLFDTQNGNESCLVHFK